MKAKHLLYTLLALMPLCGCDEPLILETTGSLSGTVTDASTHSPISNASVTITGKSFTTGADGTYLFSDLDEGDYNISIYAQGYTGENKQFSVKAGKETIADFSLYPEYVETEVSTGSLDFGTTLDKLTFEISKPNRSSVVEWSIEKQSNANWLTFSDFSGKLSAQKTTVSVYLLRGELTEDKIYTTTFFVNVKNGGSHSIKVTAERKSAVLAASPSSLNFGTSETEKSVLLSNATQEGVISYKATANESWMSLENAEGTISDTGIASLKVKVNRESLSAGDFNGSIIISSNKNTVTVPVSMQVLGHQPPEVNNLQCSQISHSSFNVSAFISSVGSASVTSYGFCWSSTNTQPTTSDNKNDMGGTAVAKSFNYTISGLRPQSTYYVRAYAINAEGISYSNALTVETLTAPTYAVVRTLGKVNVGYDSATIKGSIDNLGDGYVTSYGFCYSSTNSNPTVSDRSMSCGSTIMTGDYEGVINDLQPKTRYFVRAYATNSVGTAYGGTIEITTTNMPPVVTSGLLAYYTFDEQNCDDFLGEIDYSGVVQGSGTEMTFTSDTPNGEGSALKGSDGGKYYKILKAPEKDINVVTHSLWIKTKNTNAGWFYRQENGDYNRGVLIKNSYLWVATYSSSGARIWGTTQLESLLCDGQWHHLVSVWKYNGSSYYIDGRFIEENQRYYNLYTDLVTGKVSFLGQYNGIMDNLRIYNRELSKDEILEIYKNKQ